MKRTAAFFVILSVSACGKPSEPSLPEPPELPPLPELSLPAAASDDYVALPAGEAFEPAWNLGRGTRHVYEGRQTARARIEMTAGGTSGTGTTDVRSQGLVEFIGGGEGRGRARCAWTPKEIVVNDEAKNPNDEQPRRFECLLREDGVFTSSKKMSGSADVHYLDVLFALPPMPLKPDEAAERELHFGAGTADYAHHGRMRLRHAGRRKVGRHECVKLVSEVDLSLTPPPPAHGIGRMIGRVISYFDPEERRFVQVDADFSMVARHRALVQPREEGQGEPHWSLGTLRSDTAFRIRLREE
ncbi:MAG: hypothetical protein HY716_15250 [Planctomycetes bacterium]|nr:hypothetical protein [Planctomycetota bacterium]